METFLQSVYFETGGYSTCDGMTKLDSRLKEIEVRLLNLLMFIICKLTSANPNNAYLHILNYSNSFC